MIDYINAMLNQWGLWCLTGRDKTGYPKQSAFMRLVPSPGRGDVLIKDDEAMRINRAVQSLDRDLRNLVDLFYVKMRSADGETIAKRVGVSVPTMYRRLHSAHQRIMFELQEMD